MKTSKPTENATPAAATARENLRRARWREHVARHLDGIRGRDSYVPAAWLEEIEGRPMVDVICDWLAKYHGCGVKNPTPEQKFRAAIDESFEEESVRRRNDHERESSRWAVALFLGVEDALDLAGEDLHDLLRRFYRRGDCGMRNAVTRAVESALDRERATDKSKSVA